MNEKTIEVIVYILISVVCLTILLLIIFRKKRENFKKCVCSSEAGGRERNCQDIATVNNSYVTGELTENSEFKNKGWSKVSPGDIDFPPSSGCDWSDSDPTEKKWGKWDFTDFGN
jgi:hypothetical protein